MGKLEGKIAKRGFELGFSNVGIADVRDYPEYLAEATSRAGHGIFTDGDDALITRLSKTKTLNPWARSVVCATLGFSSVDYPTNLASSVARTYLARVYSPLPGTVHAFQISQFADYLEELGLRVERNQFCMPQRLVCAESGITTFGNNNFAYTKQDGSFCILVTFLVDRFLERGPITPQVAACALESADPSISPSEGASEWEGSVRNGCPPDCSLCQDACPTGAIPAPGKLDIDKCILFNNQRFAPGAQEEVWEDMGLRIHGCDACQEACPRNIAPLSKATREDQFLEVLSKQFDLEKVLMLDEDYYEEVVRPIMYNYIRDLDIFRRNAAVALGNSGDATHLRALRKAREQTENPEVLKAIDWAMERLSQ